MLSTDRWRDGLALVVFFVLAAWLLRDGFAPDHVMISKQSLRNSLPWSAVLDPAPPTNRFVGDQPRIYYPYLLEAARVYAGEAGALWTSRGGGGQPFLGNITSALFHPLTLLAAILPVTLVPLLQGLAVLTLSAWLTWLFLRRLELSVPAAAFGALAFGFGGHQVLWLQYALSHTLLALPFTFWAVERVVAFRSRRRVAVLAAGFALLVFGGHPETGFVSGIVAGLWALYRLWDSHGRALVFGAALLGAALAAIQWLPFYEYAQLSHGLRLREIEAARAEGGASFGAASGFVLLLLMAAGLLRTASTKGLTKQIFAAAACTVVIVMARRMGMAMSASVSVFPELYGSPLHGGLFQRDGIFTGAQDFPGLDSGYVGVLAPVLLGLGFFAGLGGGFIRFFAMVAVLLWGAEYHMPGIEGVVRLVPGLSEVGSTRLLGPVGFCAACGGALVLERLCHAAERVDMLRAVGRVAMTVVLTLGLSYVVLQLPFDPHGRRRIKTDPAFHPQHELVHDGRTPIRIAFPLTERADDLRISVDGMLLRSGPAEAMGPDWPFSMFSMYFAAQRTEEGRHRLQVEIVRDGELSEFEIDQPLAISRARRLSSRDLLACGLSLSLLGWMLTRQRPRGAWLASLIVGLDVLTLANGYNEATPADELYPPTRTAAFLQEADKPFRIFTEGTILPPDTQFVVGVDHLLSYDNLGYALTYKWLVAVPIGMDAFATFTFDASHVDYASARFDALDVRYVLTDLRTDLSRVPGMLLVHESETRIWENTDNLGRAFLVGRTIDLERAPLDELLSVDPEHVAFVEGAWSGELGGSGQARVLEHEGGYVRVATHSDGPALLVLAENRAPGWTASIDGGPEQETVPADVAWQAVEVPAGEHEIVFRYDPVSYRWGLSITLLAAVAWLLMLVYPRYTS